MAKSFELKFINGPTGDPALLIQFKKTGAHILIDCGHLDSAAPRELLKARNLFVSHTHVDHFIGFDRLIRLNIPHGKKLHVWGPKNIIRQVQNKLQGYTWNLIAANQLPFEVTEIQGKHATTLGLLGKYNNFQAEITPLDCQDFLVHLEGGVKVRGVALDHKGTDSIAYHFQFPRAARVRGEKLQDLGYETGPWIQTLVDHAIRGNVDGSVDVGGQKIQISTLTKELIVFEEPESLLYVTDASFDKENLDRILMLGSASTIVCESSFSDEDLSRSIDKAHLTSKQAAMIACSVSAHEFIPFHVSNIYGDKFGDILQEAQNHFVEYKSLSKQDLGLKIKNELCRIAAFE